MEALHQPTIRVIAVIAEGVPEADTKQLIAYAAQHNKIVLGPATVGGLQVFQLYPCSSFSLHFPSLLTCNWFGTYSFAINAACLHCCISTVSRCDIIVEALT